MKLGGALRFADCRCKEFLGAPLVASGRRLPLHGQAATGGGRFEG